MKKTFLSLPILLGLVVLVFGIFYVHQPLTSHNPGHSHSIQPNDQTRDVKKAEDLRVLSYNVHGLPHTANPWCDNLVRIGMVLKDMRANGTAPHVIALQEGFHVKIHDLIRLSGYPYVEQGPTGPDQAMTSGLWILSEYPIRPLSQTVFTACATWDCFAHKGVQHAAISVPGLEQEVEVYNTHMNASNGKGDFWTTRSEILTAKLAQVRQFATYVTRTRNHKVPTLVIGDFNFRPGDIIARLFHDRTMGLLNTASMILGRTPRVVDHQFFVPGPKRLLKPVSWEKTFQSRVNSDHSGILVNYERR